MTIFWSCARRRSAGIAAFDPDFLGGHLAEGGGSGGSFDRERLVVVLFEDFDPAAGGEAKLVEEGEQLGVALVEADDVVLEAFSRVGEQEVAAFGALGGRLRQDGIAVGTDS